MLKTNLRRFAGRGRDPHEPAAEAGGAQQDQYLDMLELRDAILGNGLVLNEAPGGAFVLHVIVAGHVRPLGWFADAAAAWPALDALDDWAAGRTERLSVELPGIAAALSG